MAGPSPIPAAPRSSLFIVISIVAAAVLSAVVGYLGLAGLLGGHIPGTYVGTGTSSPSHCEGSDLRGNYSFQIIAGERGMLTFNGTVPGPCLKVGVMSQVTVIFAVASDASANHSWVLVGATSLTNAPPTFSGAGFSNATRFSGLAPEHSATFHFQPTTAGVYRYICEVPGHEEAGMWGPFEVSLAAPVAVVHVNPTILQAVPVGPVARTCY